ncbi:MAG: helix-turn-helix domain-containing protein [Blastocatellia bacterium]|nr:helix-turn-helix domain-containing protein [Blastocatellia bacterium]
MSSLSTANPSPLRLVNPFPLPVWPDAPLTRLDPCVVQVIKRMVTDLSQPYYLEDLAAEVNLCPRQLERLFQQETHFTPLQYLKRLRLEKAKALLLDFTLSIKEVRLEVGYQHANWFGVDFKEAFGITPQQYRAGK